MDSWSSCERLRHAAARLRKFVSPQADESLFRIRGNEELRAGDGSDLVWAKRQGRLERRGRTLHCGY
jgi:hypothetical protein